VSILVIPGSGMKNCHGWKIMCRVSFHYTWQTCDEFDVCFVPTLAKHVMGLPCVFVATLGKQVIGFPSIMT
jgi:hypothetical protein